MKTSFLFLGVLLALTSCGGADNSAPGATATVPAAAPATTPATVFADSIAALPNVQPADVAAGRAYAQAFGSWAGSDLPTDIKDHPLADGIWQQYRTVLRQVVASRGLKKVKPEDAATWDGFAAQCEQVAKTLVPLTQDQPAPTTDKAVPQMQASWDAMQSVRLAAERHMMYLQHPYTRTLR